MNEARPLSANVNHEPGEIVAVHDEIVVACRDRLLSLSAVMLEPDETATIAEAVAALALRPGQRTHFE